MDCNGATYVYAWCIALREHICGKIQFLSLGTAKGDFKFAEGNEMPSKQFAWSEAKFVVTYGNFM